MHTTNETSHENSPKNDQGHFSTLEMELILSSLEKDKSDIDQDKMDRVVQAWSKVERKKLFKN